MKEIKTKSLRDKKKIVNGEIVRERKGLTRTNKPIKLPDNPTWLKQPNLVTMLSGDLSNLHSRIIISLVEKLQDSISQSINKVPIEQLSLFKEHKETDQISLMIPFKDFELTSNNYPELKKALKEMDLIPVEFDTKDPITGGDTWCVPGLFSAFIPDETYQRTIKITIKKDVAKILVNVDKGFTKYIKEIAFQTQSKYTVRMYMLISSWKDKGSFSITLERVKKWLKLENK